VGKDLKASEIAARYNVQPITVKRWIKSGMFPNARFEETVAGSIWLIPESDLKNFTPPVQGRPRKSKI
jgi:predicted site-specific integrase-resolvase